MGEGIGGWGLPYAGRATSDLPVCRRRHADAQPAQEPNRHRDGSPRHCHFEAGAHVRTSPRAIGLLRGDATRFGGRPARRMQRTRASAAPDLRTFPRIVPTYVPQASAHLAPGSSPARTRRGTQPVEPFRPQSTQPADSSTRRNAPRPFAIDVSSPSGGPNSTYRFSLRPTSTSLSGTRSRSAARKGLGNPACATKSPRNMGPSLSGRASVLHVRIDLLGVRRPKGTRGLP